MILFYVILTVSTLFCVGSSLTIFKIYKMRNWPSTKAIVLKSFVTKEMVKQGGGFNHIIVDKPNIEYSYKVSEKTIANTQIKPTQLTIRAEKICKEYPVGSIVKIYYNPEKNDESFLKKDRLSPAIYFFLSGTIMIILSFVFKSKIM